MSLIENQESAAPTVEERRRSHFLRAAIVGVVAGLLAVGFQHALRWSEAARNEIVDAAGAHGIWAKIAIFFAITLVIGTIGALTPRLCPEAAGSGIPHLKGVLLGFGTIRPIRLLATKFFGAVLGIGAGLSLGREGPTIQMGAAAAAAVAKVAKVPERSVSRMLTAGAGAGLAAAFNAPLAGFVFVIEELRREISTRTYGSALIASLLADMLSRFLNGQSPIFHIARYPLPRLSSLPIAAAVGLVAALVGIVFSHGVLATKSFNRCAAKVPVFWRSAVLGLVVATMVFVFPEAVGGGHRTAETVLAGHFPEHGPIAWLFWLVVAKLALTVISYATGAPGGIFMPMLVIGAATGALLGFGAFRISPTLAPYPGVFAVVGMAAIFSAVVRAPLTGIVLIVEMTGNYDQTFALSVACLVAYLVAEKFGPPPIYEALLHQRSLAADGAVGDVDPVHFHVVVESGSRLDGVRVADAGFPDGALIVEVRRAGIASVPNGPFVLRSGDELTVSLGSRVAAIEIEKAARA